MKYPSLGPPFTGSCRWRDPDRPGCSGGATEHWQPLPCVVRSGLSRWKVVPCETDGDGARSMATRLVWTDSVGFVLFFGIWKNWVGDLGRLEILELSLGWFFEEKLDWKLWFPHLCQVFLWIFALFSHFCEVVSMWVCFGLVLVCSLKPIIYIYWFIWRICSSFFRS